MGRLLHCSQRRQERSRSHIAHCNSDSRSFTAKQWIGVATSTSKWISSNDSRLQLLPLRTPGHCLLLLLLLLSSCYAHCFYVFSTIQGKQEASRKLRGCKIAIIFAVLPIRQVHTCGQAWAQLQVLQNGGGWMFMVRFKTRLPLARVLQYKYGQVHPVPCKWPRACWEFQHPALFWPSLSAKFWLDIITKPQDLQITAKKWYINCQKLDFHFWIAQIECRAQI